MSEGPSDTLDVDSALALNAASATAALIPVVAVGASAGGLEALEKLFVTVPANTGAAFVVIQHLAPDHKSMMAELLARHTNMPVHLVAHGTRIRANEIYLIPPARLMTLQGDQLLLTEKPPHSLTLPIDVFFASLAKERGERAIGIVLSGTGSDGSRGGVTIRQAGGFIMVQEPTNARFDGMPRSAIAMGLTQAVLDTDKLAATLLAHLKTLPQQRAVPEIVPPDDATQASGDGELPLDDATPELMAAIIKLLTAASGIDFKEYKSGTVTRRIAARMNKRGVSALRDYVLLLQADKDEVRSLQAELLIAVTQFFRDADAFEALRTLVVEPIVSQRESNQPIRIWCAGVATGEEAYSIAMLFLDALEKQHKWPGVKVFATDVSALHVDIAAKGQYQEAAIAELPADWVARYFNRTNNRVTINSTLRQSVIFARHDLLSDPPFTRMDLVVCRNTLIYFTTEAQRHVLRRLQYALAPNGYLFLGKSESIGELEPDFQTVDSRQKLWRMVRPTPYALSRGYQPLASQRATHSRHSSNPRTTAPTTDQDAALTLLRTTYAPPPAVLLNERHEVLHAYGDVSAVLTLRAGQVGLEITKLLPDNWVPCVSALLHKATHESMAVRSEALRLDDDSDARALRLVVLPITSDASGNKLMVFEEVNTTLPEATMIADVAVDTVTAERMELLEHELALTRQSLQHSIEELETSNEELQATNEELMASNEELQSTNEELQSVNEELNTINAEYQEKITVLDRVNSDLDSLTRIAAAGAVFVDESLSLTRYSPDAPKVFRIRPQDIGRPIADLTHDLHYPDFFDDLRHCVASLLPVEKDVTASKNRHFLVKMLPYRVPSSAQQAAVISFTESTKVHEATQLQRILDALAEHIAVIDHTGRIRMVNASWRKFAAENGDPEMVNSGPGASYFAACADLTNQVDQAHGARALAGIRDVLAGRLERFSMEYPCHSATQQRWFVMHVRPLHGDQAGAVVSHINITAWMEARTSSGE